MTDFGQRVTALGAALLVFLETQEQPVDAGELVGKFCKERRYNRRDAEMALALLLDTGQIEIDEDMRVTERVHA